MINRYFNHLELLNKKSSVLLLGPRGTGKTALIGEAFQQISNHVRIDLLQGRDFQRYLNAPYRWT